MYMASTDEMQREEIIRSSSSIMFSSRIRPWSVGGFSHVPQVVVQHIFFILSIAIHWSLDSIDHQVYIRTLFASKDCRSFTLGWLTSRKVGEDTPQSKQGECRAWRPQSKWSDPQAMSGLRTCILGVSFTVNKESSFT
jgi:hypothetical protein